MASRTRFPSILSLVYASAVETILKKKMENVNVRIINQYVTRELKTRYTLFLSFLWLKLSNETFQAT